MARIVLAVLIVAAVIMCSHGSSAHGSNENELDVSEDSLCQGKHEFWNDCGTPCPLTCAQPQTRPCVRRCNPACQCEEGLLRRRDGACVEQKYCF